VALLEKLPAALQCREAIAVEQFVHRISILHNSLHLLLADERLLVSNSRVRSNVHLHDFFERTQDLTDVAFNLSHRVSSCQQQTRLASVSCLDALSLRMSSDNKDPIPTSEDCVERYFDVAERCMSSIVSEALVLSGDAEGLAAVLPTTYGTLQYYTSRLHTSLSYSKFMRRFYLPRLFHTDTDVQWLEVESNVADALMMQIERAPIVNWPVDLTNYAHELVRTFLGGEDGFQGARTYARGDVDQAKAMLTEMSLRFASFRLSSKVVVA